MQCQQLITISGNLWSSAESWMGSNSDWMGPSNISDPLNNWCYEMHQYFDGAGGTTVCQPTWSISGKLGPVTTWARTNKAYLSLPLPPTLHARKWQSGVD
jgi:hypothetical protein